MSNETKREYRHRQSIKTLNISYDIIDEFRLGYVGCGYYKDINTQGPNNPTDKESNISEVEHNKTITLFIHLPPATVGASFEVFIKNPNVKVIVG